ncbi:MAG: response regulator [Vulcanimicrobiaceae bacterium]
MVTEMSSRSGGIKLARDAAQTLVTRFGLQHARVWLSERDQVGEATLIASASAAGEPEFAGFTPWAAAAVLASESPKFEVLGAPMGGALLGFPFRTGEVSTGYVEAYAAQPGTFARAAEIERYVAEFAAVLASVFATAALESAARGTILVVDDDPATRMLARRILAIAGFGVLEAADGDAALAAARRDRPDLILMDWSMPVMDGAATTAQLKADPNVKAIPVVMLTTDSESGYRVAALEAGAQDFITKPFEAGELVTRIEQFLRWRKLLAAAQSGPAQASPRRPRVSANLNHAARESTKGNQIEALELFVAEAEACERSMRYADAARAYRAASVVALDIRKDDLSNKFLRLTGKMYLCWAETTTDSRAVELGYVQAAKCFLAAGNMKLVEKSIEMATSFELASADSPPRAAELYVGN